MPSLTQVKKAKSRSKVQARPKTRTKPRPKAKVKSGLRAKAGAVKTRPKVRRTVKKAVPNSKNVRSRKSKAKVVMPKTAGGYKIQTVDESDGTRLLQEAAEEKDQTRLDMLSRKEKEQNEDVEDTEEQDQDESDEETEARPKNERVEWDEDGEDADEEGPEPKKEESIPKKKPIRKKKGPVEEHQAKLTEIHMIPLKHEATGGTHYHDCLIVIFGATGELAKSKIIPALYNLIKNEELRDFAVVGVSRKTTTAVEILEMAKPNIKDIKKDIWDKLRSRFVFQKANFYHEEELDLVKDVVENTEKEHGLSGNRLFYLAIRPKHFETIIQHLEKHKLAHGKEAWNRVVFEKPFGEDLPTARQINKHIRRVFREDQIFRVDHYLDEELMQNLLASRFTNEALGAVWNKRHIDHVQIIISEDFGIDGKGSFYDKYGALKDVVQNHMLQLLCLVAMEAPKSLKADHIRDSKVKLLKRIKPFCRSDTVLAQFEGYRRESGVTENSETETFAAIKTRVRNRRWRKVPFYLLTGKNLPLKASMIYIQFKDMHCDAYKKVNKYQPNHLVIQIQPQEGMYFQLNTKVPGKNDLQTIDLEFTHSCTYGPNTPEAYENLFLQVIRGDQSVFVRSDEIEQEWKIIEGLLEKRPKLQTYDPGKIPEKAQELIRKDGREWHQTLK
ncbi:TPA: glucose-6-phosphate dehydrogenase [Candidatus Woesearchaeota archaeon]|nr:glucose-6-phosphate dehydrogenase [Candidatus Woesearchaeota archaeon]